jgi:hypothetical protein
MNPFADLENRKTKLENRTSKIAHHQWLDGPMTRPPRPTASVLPGNRGTSIAAMNRNRLTIEASRVAASIHRKSGDFPNSLIAGLRHPSENH